jgi:hypothetical protein
MKGSVSATPSVEICISVAFKKRSGTPNEVVNSKTTLTELVKRAPWLMHTAFWVPGASLLSAQGMSGRGMGAAVSRSMVSATTTVSLPAWSRKEAMTP